MAYLFLDPIILILPPIDSLDDESFFEYIERLNRWASALNNHKVYVSEKCRDLLYDGEYPPTPNTFKKYLTHFDHEGIYSASDIGVACQRLFDLDGLKSIEQEAQEQDAPLFEVKSVSIDPNAIHERHTSEMQKALSNSLGNLVYLQHKNIIEIVMFASYETDGEMLLVSISVDTVGEKIEESLLLDESLKIIIDPDDIAKYSSESEEIQKNMRILLVGGHDSIPNKLGSLIESTLMDFHHLRPDEDNKISSIIQNIHNFDGIIYSTKYVTHKFSKISEAAKKENILLKYVNTTGISGYKQAIFDISYEIKTRDQT
jgi:hypothetical protein